jgi:hypothetical protein
MDSSSQRTPEPISLAQLNTIRVKDAKSWLRLHPTLLLAPPSCSELTVLPASLCSVPRPLVLDPADPTWNVGQGDWKLLAQEAAALGSQVCLQSGDGTLVPPWDVTVRNGALGPLR